MNVLIKGTKGEVGFTPYLMNKNTLGFSDCTIKDLKTNLGDMFLNENCKEVEIRSKNKRFLIQVDNNIYKEALSFKNKELKDFKNYYDRLSNSEEEIICYLDGDSSYVRTLTSWEKGFAPYWDKMFRFVLEKETGGLVKDNDNEGKFQEDIYNILKLSLGRQDVNIIEDVNGKDKYFKVNIKTFISYLLS